MVKARLTSKGQITVPKAVRKRLGIQPGDELLFEIRGDHVEVVPKRRQGVAEFVGLFRAKRALRNERGRAWTAETRRLGTSQRGAR